MAKDHADITFDNIKVGDIVSSDRWTFLVTGIVYTGGLEFAVQGFSLTLQKRDQWSGLIRKGKNLCFPRSSTSFPGHLCEVIPL